ncbi:glutamate-rich protein 3-like isoform X2 [Anguilla rostrata]|uniref:glutamate-rich protein 3-like isoform X2 n=1 Tax=Anguilla rostrata TaxID=7938 RepID=UPI0030D5ACCC
MSSVISQINFRINKKQEHRKGLQKTCKQSNVTMTMTYLGQGLMERSHDEMKVLQQICGGENICVFRGYLHPGEQFQFVSRRRCGFPFSISLFVNGMMAARISSCCEYRYSPGFQQGRRSCFRFTDLSGGLPCFRCASSIRNKNGKRLHLYNGMKGKLLLSTLGKPAKGEKESCPSSSLFIPFGKEMPLLRWSRKDSKDVNSMSTDTEDMNSVKVNRGQKKTKEQHCSRAARKKSNMEEHLTEDYVTSGKKQGVHIKKSRCVMSNKKETCKLEKETVEERHQLWKETAVRDLCGDMSNSELELSDDSESILYSKNTSLLRDLRGEDEGSHSHVANVSTFGSSRLGYSNSLDLNQLYTECKEMTMSQEEKEHNLETQVEAMISMLESCDLVEQLVLRNTGITDELLNCLVTALKNSPSEVVLINLNLNNIGPPGVQILLNLVKLNPQVKGLLLFGNHLGDKGVCTLLNGLADLQGQTVGQRTLQLWSGGPHRMDTLLLPRETSRKATPLHTHITQAFVLFELDLGGNGVSSEGLRVLSSYLRCHSQLKYLGLAKTNVADISAWETLFDSLTTNVALIHIILDECHLGDQGVELFAKMLRYNQSLTKIDLDYNSIGDRGGNAIIEALLNRRFILMSHLSLEGNYISFALIKKIQQEIQLNSSNNY